jgi:hypothetical protein
MKKTVLMLFTLALFATPMMAETWKSAAVVDKMCASKAKADPDKHTRACALQCKGSGYGVVTDKGEFLAFDDEGNKKMTAALQSTDKKDHLRADITGTRKGETIQVEQLTLQ